MTVPAQDSARTGRGRLVLIGLFVLFFGSALGAGMLRFSGWMPAGLKNHGELLQPPVDLRQHPPQLAGGGHYAWEPEARTWRILAVAPAAGCGADCAQVLEQLDKVWRLFGHKADHVDVLWLGAPPPDAERLRVLHVLQDDAALRGALPRSADPAGIPLYVVDPNGFVILRYRPGTDPGHLRTDVARLLKLR
ncbi:hypothetical protein [Pseudoxanthomonas koreensis]|uniref:hypothetical protein n=1 Tax=Pseudoxanthomonas koreensis TaxID=266061 RepID=UPI0035A69D55